jgi:hypothetical protein
LEEQFSRSDTVLVDDALFLLDVGAAGNGVLGVIRNDHVDHEVLPCIHLHFLYQILKDILLVILQLICQLLQANELPIFIYTSGICQLLVFAP